MVGKLIELARDRGATPLQRDAIAREWIELQALRYTAYRSLSALMKTGIPGPEGSILKQQWSEAAQRADEARARAARPRRPAPRRQRPVRRLLAAHAAPQPRQHDRGRHLGDPAQHHRRARARPAEVALMDFAFTPEQEELRAQARAFLAANPEPSWQELAELGWTGVSVAGGERRRRARVPRGGDPVRGDGARAHPRAVLVDRRRHAAGAPGRPAGRGGAAARRAGRSRPARSSPISTPRRASPYVGGDTIWELEGFEREVLRDERRDAAARRRLGRRGRARARELRAAAADSAPAR